MSNVRNSRQSFLGPDAERIIRSTRIAVLGLGGGGSHVVQQLAHVGFEHLLLCDPEHVEESNLNRLVGATLADATNCARKTEVAARLVKGILPANEALTLPHRWQEAAEQLRHVDLVFGCLDGFAARGELEAFTRRFFIPLIDVGLDVAIGTDGRPQMAGQVIFSMPGYACMQCMGFLNSLVLAQEAGRYGKAGIRPQVVWANGVLASAAVGIALDLLTGWTRATQAPVYLEYNGNSHTLVRPVRLDYVTRDSCPHFPADEAGIPALQAL